MFSIVVGRNLSDVGDNLDNELGDHIVNFLNGLFSVGSSEENFSIVLVDVTVEYRLYTANMFCVRGKW